MLPPDLPDFLTRSELATLLRVSLRCVDKWAANPDFPRPIRIGGNGHPRWPRTVIESYIRSQTAAPAEGSHAPA